MREVSKTEFNNKMKKLNLGERDGQYEFYSRTRNFINGSKKFLINPAGMGLGKTIPTTILIKEFLDKYDLTFIANPTATLKYVWVENIHNVGLLNKTSVWPSKRDVCIYKQLFKDKKFPLSRCSDDCVYQKKCKEDKDYTHECREDYERYINMGKNAIPLNYYEKLIKDNKIDKNDYLKNKKTFPFNCLYAPTRMGLRDLYIKDTRKIIIGDYNGFLMEKMFMDVTTLNPLLLDSLLIIDEGHLINIRARGHYSKSMYVKRDLQNLEKEFEKYKNKLDPFYHTHIIILIEHLKKFIIKVESKFVKKTAYGYKYNEFKQDFIDEDNHINNILESLDQLSKVMYSNEDDEGQKNSTKRIYEYLSSLKLYSELREYFCSIELKKYYNNDDIKLDCSCIDPSSHLRNIFEKWDKVIINTGTLSKEKNIVLSEIGIDGENYDYKEPIKSYNLSEYTFIFKEDDFGSNKRMNTYDNNSKKILEVIDKLSGKTIIFIQAKYNSLQLEHILSKKVNVINFCTKENDDDEISSEEFEKLKTKFSNIKGKCVGIININGRVEGHNFTDDESIPQVSNVIVYGFPLPHTNELIKAREMLYIKKFSDEQKILNHVYLNEPIQKIQQACYRCKRNEKSNPIIILWGLRFSPDKEIFLYKNKNDWKYVNKEYNVFNSLPLDFKKNVGNYKELIKFIQKREDVRINITH